MSLQGVLLLREWERKSKINRPPWIPVIHSFAARLAGLTPEELCSQAGEWSKALLDCQRLFGYDGITVSFDPSMEAEALGCELRYEGKNGLPVVSGSLSVEEWLDAELPTELSGSGQVPVLIETVKRLRKQVNGPALCCLVGGIRPLIRELLDDHSHRSLQINEEMLPSAYQKAQKALLQWSKQLAELRPDLLVIREEAWGGPDAGQMNQLYQPVLNVIKYFRVPVIFQLSAGQDAPFPFISHQESGHVQAVGQVLPPQLLDAETGMEELEQIWRTFYRRQANPFLLTTADELAWETDVDRLKDIHDVVMI